MEFYGLLINYNYCSGCRTCEMACQQDHGYPPSMQGLTLTTIGPHKLPNGKWQFDNLPLHTPTATTARREFPKESSSPAFTTVNPVALRLEK